MCNGPDVYIWPGKEKKLEFSLIFIFVVMFYFLHSSLPCNIGNNSIVVFGFSFCKLCR